MEELDGLSYLIFPCVFCLGTGYKFPPVQGACLFLEGREKNVNKQICFSSLPGHWQEIISLVQQYLPILH